MKLEGTMKATRKTALALVFGLLPWLAAAPAWRRV